eukprot:SAG11_NODE_160_length_14023_cov_23.003017_8_plen_426_part_00
MISLDAETVIDAGPIGNLARFANHSCEPNMVMQKWNVNGTMRVGLFACKEIEPNEELTWNYNLDSFEGHNKLRCYCGAMNCSGFIGVKAAGEKGSLVPKLGGTKPRKAQKAKAKVVKTTKAASAAGASNQRAGGGRKAAVRPANGLIEPTHFRRSSPLGRTGGGRALPTRLSKVNISELRKLARRPTTDVAPVQLRKALAPRAIAAEAQSAAARQAPQPASESASAAVGGGRKKGRVGKAERVRKDPNAPKRPTSAYFFFQAARRAVLLTATPGLKASTVAQRLGAEWQAMGEAERAPYEVAQVADRARYAKELVAYASIKAKAQAEANAAKETAAAAKEVTAKVAAKAAAAVQHKVEDAVEPRGTKRQRGTAREVEGTRPISPPEEPPVQALLTLFSRPFQPPSFSHIILHLRTHRIYCDASFS